MLSGPSVSSLVGQTAGGNMKKFLFVLVALMAVSSALSAYGMPLPTAQYEFRLRFEDSPLKFSGHRSSDDYTYTLWIENDGDVWYEVRGSRALFGPPQVVERLTGYQMDWIENLIDEARLGTIKPTGPVYCEAIPTRQRLIDADNGGLLLERGSHPCGGGIFNDSPATKTLVDFLTKLYSKAHKDLN